jgi:hypothetical protein
LIRRWWAVSGDPELHRGWASYHRFGTNKCGTRFYKSRKLRQSWERRYRRAVGGVILPLTREELKRVIIPDDPRFDGRGVQSSRPYATVAIVEITANRVMRGSADESGAKDFPAIRDGYDMTKPR